MVNDLLAKLRETHDEEDEAMFEGTPEEKLEYFEKRTQEHIDRVKVAAQKIVDAGVLGEHDGALLLDQVQGHDASKLEEPERTPYIEISWRHKFDNYKSYKKPGTLDQGAENEATMHHILNNSHHPEYHLDDKNKANINSEDRDKSDTCIDASNMPAVDLAEMCADWQAMSEELKNNTAREWYDKQKDVRWHYSEEQDELIDKLLGVFE